MTSNDLSNAIVQDLNSVKAAVDRRLTVQQLKLILSFLYIPSSGLKPVLLSKFWSAYKIASTALLSGNKIALKLFAHSLAKCGRVDVIQILQLHTVQDIAGYQSQPLSPPPQRSDFEIFSTDLMVDAPRIPSLNQSTNAASRTFISCSDGRVFIGTSGEPSSAAPTAVSSALNADKIVLKPATSRPASKTNVLGSDSAPDAKNFSHYVFKKPPNFTTVKCLKRFVVKDCSTMQSPIFFTLENSFLDRLKDDHRVKVFVAVIKQHKLPDNDKKVRPISVSLPRGFTTMINGTVIYQEV